MGGGGGEGGWGVGGGGGGAGEGGDAPSVTNGIIAFYVIERRAKGQALPMNVSRVMASLPRQFTDTVQPLTTYYYRIVAHTRAGGTPGPYANITTAEGGNTAI